MHAYALHQRVDGVVYVLFQVAGKRSKYDVAKYRRAHFREGLNLIVENSLNTLYLAFFLLRPRFDFGACCISIDADEAGRPLLGVGGPED